MSSSSEEESEEEESSSEEGSSQSGSYDEEEGSYDEEGSYGIILVVSRSDGESRRLHLGQVSVVVEHPFIRGDASTDGRVDLSDSVLTLTYLFRGTVSPPCLDALDFDDSGDLDLTDAIASLMFQFMGGEAPPAPSLGSCGLDETADLLRCRSSFHCDQAAR